MRAHSRLGLGLLSALSFVACDEAKPALNEATPVIELLEGLVLDFGPVTEGTSATESVPVSNPSQADLSVQARMAPGGSDDFSISTTTFDVSPLSEHAFEVTFTPKGTGDDRATLIFESDDPDHPALEVDLRGGPIAPKILTTPDPVDFGPASDPVVTKPMAIKNVGAANLTVSEATVDEDSNRDFSVRALEWPQVIPPNDEIELVLDYTRGTDGTAGQLLVRSDDPNDAVHIVRLLPDPLHDCQDGMDNDGDNLIDYPDDPGCTSETDNSEDNPPECDDGMMQSCGSNVGLCVSGMRTCANRVWGPCENDTGPDPEVCDGLDNDCDGVDDNDVTEACTTNGCSGARACIEDSGTPGGEWGPCIPVNAVPEECDGLDNDCNGMIDDGVTEACIVSDCGGTRVCVPGGSGEWTSCQITPMPESCDLVDNDCDGMADNGIPDQTCGTGVCQNTASGCMNGLVPLCTPNVPDPRGEVCGDGLDNDCDGSLDNGYNLGMACAVGVGECRRSGQEVCAAGGLSTECNVSPGNPVGESCNGLDDDCDNATDEDFPLGSGCTVGVGYCQNSGQLICSGDGTGTVCNVSPGAPLANELCGNGVDDDCDMSTDEGFGNLGNACTAGFGPCQASGNLVCSNDQLSLVCDAQAGAPGPNELCGNGIDDDCDNSVDEGFANLGNPCSVGVGACQASGNYVCSANLLTLTCDAVAGMPGTEVCGNGIDENCNGMADDVCQTCGPQNTSADTYEPNDSYNSPKPWLPHTMQTTYVYDYEITFPVGDDHDWMQFDFPYLSTGVAQVTAEILCVSWGAGGCANAPTVGLEAWYDDEATPIFRQLDIGASDPGTSGLAFVQSNGPDIAFGQWFQIHAYRSSSVCAGEAINAELRVTLTFSP